MLRLIALLSLMIIVLGVGPTNNFTSGNTISSADVNTNFTELYQKMPVKVVVANIGTQFAVNPFATDILIPDANISNPYIDNTAVTFSTAPVKWTYTALGAGLQRMSFLIKTSGTVGTLNVKVFVNATEVGSAGLTGLISPPAILFTTISGDVVEVKFNDGSMTPNIDPGTYIVIEKIL